jgi:hypothetical protein
LVQIKLFLSVIAQMAVQHRIRSKEHLVEFEMLLKDRIQEYRNSFKEPEVVVLRVRRDCELERLKQRLYQYVFLLILV